MEQEPNWPILSEHAQFSKAQMQMLTDELNFGPTTETDRQPNSPNKSSSAPGFFSALFSIIFIFQILLMGILHWAFFNAVKNWWNGKIARVNFSCKLCKGAHGAQYACGWELWAAKVLRPIRQEKHKGYWPWEKQETRRAADPGSGVREQTVWISVGENQPKHRFKS